MILKPSCDVFTVTGEMQGGFLLPVCNKNNELNIGLLLKNKE